MKKSELRRLIREIITNDLSNAFFTGGILTHSEPYYQTIPEAIESGIVALPSGFELSAPYTLPDPNKHLGIGDSWSHSYGLVDKRVNGEPDKQYNLNIDIVRTQSGKYELTASVD